MIGANKDCNTSRASLFTLQTQIYSTPMNGNITLVNDIGLENLAYTIREPTDFCGKIIR